jgi:hypothetical protein
MMSINTEGPRPIDRQHWITYDADTDVLACTRCGRRAALREPAPSRAALVELLGVWIDKHARCKPREDA